MEGEDDNRSECSSGCQSGWTMYLDRSSENHRPTSHHSRKATSWQEEEEDLSMVSDASSGPPHYHEQDEHFCDGPPTAALSDTDGKRKRAAKGKQHTVHEPLSFLDDTASSPLFGYSKNNNVEEGLEFSCGFSATHFKGKSVFQKHLGRLQSTSPGKPATSRQ